jgi:parvulin-like peptidyl-prolyl isomerase
VLNGVHRFDDRLPAILCRMAWQLKDGEISEVVESQYGWHLIKRLEFGQNIFMLFTDDAMPAIKIIMKRAMQEQHLFSARESAKVELKF